jgi:hypothetical protein
MPRVASALVVLIAALAPGAGVAQVYKCTEADGRKVYQDRPCAGAQQSAPYDPGAANVTTIDSEAARREAQEALVTREAGREAREDERDADRRVEYVPYEVPVPVYPPEPVYYPYPVYRDDHRHPRHDRPRGPRRPDETPMIPPARGGGGYVPAPPTVRDVAPRPPASSSRGAGSSRDER